MHSQRPLISGTHWGRKQLQQGPRPLRGHAPWVTLLLLSQDCYLDQLIRTGTGHLESILVLQRKTLFSVPLPGSTVPLKEVWQEPSH